MGDEANPKQPSADETKPTPREDAPATRQAPGGSDSDGDLNRGGEGAAEQRPPADS